MRYNELIKNSVLTDDGLVGTNALRESNDDDELFGATKTNWAHAIAATLHKLVKEAKHYLQISNPEEDTMQRTEMRIAMKECAQLATALRGGIKEFISALDGVSRNTVDSIDATLAMEHQVSLAELEQAFGFHDHLDEEESDDEMFGTTTTQSIANEVVTWIKDTGADPADGDFGLFDETGPDAASDFQEWTLYSLGEEFYDSIAHLLDSEIIKVIKKVNMSLRALGYVQDQVNEEADDDELFGEQSIIKKVQGLLKSKQKVISKMMGAMGVIYDISPNGAFGLKPLNKPYSKMRYSWGPFSPDKLQDFYLVNNHERGHWELRSRAQDAALAQYSEG